MKRLSIIGLMALAALATLLVTSACSSKPKPSPHIASEVEESFKQRWVAKRAVELQAIGRAIDADQARHIANSEFKQHFPMLAIWHNADTTGAAQ